MTFSSIPQLLDELAPLVAAEESSWEDVLQRAERLSGGTPELNGRAPATQRRSRAPHRFRRRVPRHPLLLALALLVVAVVPVSALAVAKHDPWWFLRGTGLIGEAPAKGNNVVIVKEEHWDGRRFALTAYRSLAGHLCYQLTEETSNGTPTPSGGGACTETIGSLVKTPGGRRRRLTISFLSGTSGSLADIVGPVVATATEVQITLGNGTVLTTQTFAAPKELGMPIRFFATLVPLSKTKGAGCKQSVKALRQTRPRRLVATGARGNVVGTLEFSAGLSFPSLCQPHRNRFIPPPELAGKKFTTVGRVIGPYGARATIAVSGVVGLHLARPLPTGKFKSFVQPSRCWRVSFSNGQSQGTCVALVKQYEPELSPEIQQAGRDTFVIVNAAPRLDGAIARVDLMLANGETLSKKPLDGAVVFAIPRNALSTTHSQRGFLTAYDRAGKLLVQDNSFGHVRFTRQPVYYRSCPPSSSCYG
jgi:hypothetical protein